MIRYLSAVLATSLVILSQSQAKDLSPQCVKHEEHAALTFFLVDRSDKFEDLSGFKSTVAAVREMVQPAERLVVGVSTARMSDVRVLLDLVRPKESIWTPKLKIRTQEKAFAGCLSEMEQVFSTQEESYPNSAIIETLSFVSKVLASDSALTKRLVIYSDMVQNSSTLSFFAAKTVDADSVLKQVEKNRMLWNLGQVDILVAGIGAHVTDQKALQIEDFWKKYFEKSGARLKFYGPILLGG